MNTCEFCGDRCCLCSACQAARKALEDAEKVSKEEIDYLFYEAEKIFEKFKDNKQGRNLLN